MNKTIGEMFRKKGFPDPDVFGVELELENIQQFHRAPDMWRAEHDGSLRDNGMEFVIRQPETIGELTKSLAALKKFFKDSGTKPKASNLTSTHIHINVTDLNLEQFVDFVAIVMMFEKDLAINSGEDRYNNYFALGSSNADLLPRRLEEVKDEESFVEFVKWVGQSDYRYSGINFDSIRRYGSLEIRYLGGQANPMDVLPWLSFYKRIKTYVRKGKVDFKTLYQNVSGLGLKEIKLLFAPPFPLDFDNMVEGIRCSQNLALGIHHVHTGAPRNGDGVNDYFKNI